MKAAHLKIFLATLGAHAATSVPETDIYPMIEYYKANDFRANPLCEGQDAPSIEETANNYPFRQSLGLKNLSARLIQQAQAFEANSKKDAFYEASQRQQHNDWTNVLKSVVAQTIEDPDANVSNLSEFGPLFYSMLQHVAPSGFCQIMGNFTRDVHCLNLYKYTQPSQVRESLKVPNDFGWVNIPEKCLQPISAGFRGQDMKFAHNVDLQTLDVLPEADIMAEGRSYYMLYKAIDHLQRYAEYTYLVAREELEQNGSITPVGPRRSSDSSNAPTGIHNLYTNSEVFEEIIPEWTTQYLFMTNEPQFLGKITLRTPFAVMASKGDDILIVLRRPITTYDARIAMYNQMSLKYLKNFTGAAHDGSCTIYQVLSGTMEFKVRSFYTAIANRPIAEQSSDPIRVTITGASIPSSGASILLALHLKDVIKEIFKDQRQVLVTAVVFGGGYVGDKELMDHVAANIGVRSISLVGDTYDLFPSPLTHSCDERVLPARTGTETGKQFHYAATPGRVLITPEKLASYGSHWEKSSLQLAALKDCAYQCFLTSKFCPEDLDTRCSTEKCESWIKL